MWQDPIVEEIHRIRVQLAAEWNFDVKAIFADLRKRQAALGDRLVPQKKQSDALSVVPTSNENIADQRKPA